MRVNEDVEIYANGGRILLEAGDEVILELDAGVDVDTEKAKEVAKNTGVKSVVNNLLKYLFRSNKVGPYMEKIAADQAASAQFIAVMMRQMGIDPNDISQRATAIKTQGKRLEGVGGEVTQEGWEGAEPMRGSNTDGFGDMQQPLSEIMGRPMQPEPRRDRPMNVNPALQKILSWEIIGNAHHDAPLFRMIDEFMLSKHPVNDKISALKKMDEAMGVEEPVGPQEVNDYIYYLKTGEEPESWKL